MIEFALVLLCTTGLTISVLRVRVLRSIAPAASPASRGPSDMSVIIPARNEADNLWALLADLRSQTVAPNEIVVVDDESSPRLRFHGGRHPERVWGDACQGAA